MSINLLEQPGSGVPTVGNDDYQKQNINQRAGLLTTRSILTDWETTAAEPKAEQGAVIHHLQNIYQVETADEDISGTPAAGINYIKATVSGSVMTLSWVTSLTGFTYNPAQGGLYNTSNEQVLNDICYKDGTAFHRGRSASTSSGLYVLNNGGIYATGGLDTNGGDIDCGDIDCGTLTASFSISSKIVRQISWNNTDTRDSVFNLIYPYLSALTTGQAIMATGSLSDGTIISRVEKGSSLDVLIKGEVSTLPATGGDFASMGLSGSIFI